MAITRNAVAAPTPVNAASVAVPYPTNAVGDVLLLTIVTASTPTATPSGWTLVASSTTVTSCATYVYWMPVATVQSGTLTVNFAASGAVRAAMASYSGADTTTAPAATTSTGGPATAITGPSRTYPGNFIFWANGRSAASTLTVEAAATGTWTASEAYENSGTNAITVTDGAYTGTTTSLTATSSASVSWNSVAVGLALAGAAQNFSDNATLAGSGSLTAGGTPGATVPAALSGSGTLSVTVTPQPKSSPALTGSGALSAVVKAGVARTAALTGSGALTAAGAVGSQNFSSSPALTGSGSLSSTVNFKINGTAALTGTGALSAVRRANAFGTAALTGSGSLNGAAGGQTVHVNVALGGTGALSAQISSFDPPPVVPPVITPDNSSTLRNITGYSVQEDAVPLDVASTEGGVGTIQLAIADASDVLDLYGTDIRLVDNFRGSTVGKITNLERSKGLVNVTAISPLGALVGENNAMPMSGTFQEVAEYYLSLGSVNSPIEFDDAVAGIEVVAQGWTGDVWLHLKQLCTANGVEVALVSDGIVFRPVRQVVINPRRLVDVTETLASDDLARSIEINYYNNVWMENTLVYPRSIEETAAEQVYTVEAGQVIEDDIQLTASLYSVMQPVCVADVTTNYSGHSSVYSVRAVDNTIVTPTQWAAGGGKIELTINPDTVTVHVKITGSSDQYYAPYRIAGRVYEPDDPTLIVTPPESTVTAATASRPTEPTAPKPPPEPKTNPTKATKPTKQTAAEKAYAAAQALYKKQQAAYNKAMAKYNAAIKAADLQDKLYQQQADEINALRSAEKDFPSLRIAGTGVWLDKGTLTLPTGVPNTATATDVGVTADSVFVDTVDEAYRNGVYTASQYRGEAHSVSATFTQVNQRSGSGAIQFYTINDFDIDYDGDTIAAFNSQWAGKTFGDFAAQQKSEVITNFENQVFGNVTGARFRWKNAMFRINSAQTADDAIQVTAIRDTLIGDFDYVHSGKTIANFNAEYAGKSLKQFGRVPLGG